MILTMKACEVKGGSYRKIESMTGIAKSTVSDVVRHALNNATGNAASSLGAEDSVVIVSAIATVAADAATAVEEAFAAEVAFSLGAKSQALL